jgi:FixJ family two-component response regulator
MPRKSPQRPLIVIVDDDPAVRGALTFSLELDGFDVEACDSGEALLRHPLSARKTCLVIDQKLPGMSGLDALARLRARNVTAPAILITSNPQRALRDAARSAGVPIVEKPLLGDALVGDIRRAFAGW